jgi:hypothetical protein
VNASTVAIVKNGYATVMAGVRRDPQDDKRRKYDESPPVQLLETLRRDQYLADKEITQASAAGSAGLHPTDRRMQSVFASVNIRHAELADAEAISEIYNEAILTTTATFDTAPKDIAERIEWLKSHDDRHPVLVALSENKIVGWSALSRWSERRAYDDTAETSFYVRSDFRVMGSVENSRRL